MKIDFNEIRQYNFPTIIRFGAGAVNELGYRISRSKVDLLKEVKQVQLQVLELQASLRKTGE